MRRNLTHSSYSLLLCFMIIAALPLQAGLFDCCNSQLSNIPPGFDWDEKDPILLSSFKEIFDDNNGEMTVVHVECANSAGVKHYYESTAFNEWILKGEAKDLNASLHAGDFAAFQEELDPDLIIGKDSPLRTKITGITYYQIYSDSYSTYAKNEPHCTCEAPNCCEGDCFKQPPSCAPCSYNECANFCSDYHDNFTHDKCIPFNGRSCASPRCAILANHCIACTACGGGGAGIYGSIEFIKCACCNPLVQLNCGTCCCGCLFLTGSAVIASYGVTVNGSSCFNLVRSFINKCLC